VRRGAFTFFASLAQTGAPFVPQTSHQPERVEKRKRRKRRRRRRKRRKRKRKG